MTDSSRPDLGLALGPIVRTLDEATPVLARGFASPTSSVEEVHALALASYDAALCRASLDPSDVRVREAFGVCASAVAAVALAVGAPVDAQVRFVGPDGQARTVLGSGPMPARMNPTLWRIGVLASLVARDPESAAALVSLPLEDLRQADRFTGDWVFAEVEALRAFVRWRLGYSIPQLGHTIADAMDATDPERANYDCADWLLDVVSWELHLAYCVARRDLPDFEASMKTALDCHLRFYGRGPGRGRLEGALPLAALAMACAAHDLGLRPSLESPLLPRWLVEGSAT